VAEALGVTHQAAISVTPPDATDPTTKRGLVKLKNPVRDVRTLVSARRRQPRS